MPDKLTSSARKLLIVEKELARDSGHYYTQVAALQLVLPNYSIHLLAGAGYDGFLGAATSKFHPDTDKVTRLAVRAKYGSLRQKLTASLKGISAFKRSGISINDILGETCRRLDLGPGDLVIVPSADLAMLEAALVLMANGMDGLPTICLRFLSPDLGEFDSRIRKRRIKAARDCLTPGRVALFTETSELATYLETEFGHFVQPYCYLPCSMQPGATQFRDPQGQDAIRIGVFGDPRRRKGSHRIAGILRATANIVKDGSRKIRFAVQGADEDFSARGIYGELTEFDNSTGSIAIERHSARMSSDAFIDLFHSVDIVLLPYDVAVYGLQGSGIVQDAVAARKLIIHSEGMSMRELLSHGNASAATTDAEFAGAIVEAANRPGGEVDAVTARALAFLRRLHQHHVLHDVVGKAGASAEAK